jgi:hypothetical protein
MGCVVSALGSNICIWCFHYDSHQHSIGRIGWVGGEGRMARMNICKEAPHVDLAFLLKLLHSSATTGNVLPAFPCSSLWQVASCLCLQISGAI